LEKVLENHDRSTRGPKQKGMEGVLARGVELLDKEAEEGVRDAGFIAAVQPVKHYEMAGYDCARRFPCKGGRPF
jgi:ferritin-like metal-binding protein YciE